MGRTEISVLLVLAYTARIVSIFASKGFNLHRRRTEHIIAMLTSRLLVIEIMGLFQVMSSETVKM